MPTVARGADARTSEGGLADAEPESFGWQANLLRTDSDRGAVAKR
jgi:hypothetical protein